MCEKIFTEYEYIDSIKYIQTQEIYIFGNHARVLNLKIYQFQISSYTVDNHKSVTKFPSQYNWNIVESAVKHLTPICLQDFDFHQIFSKWQVVGLSHFVRPSRYRYMVCLAISSYSFGATHGKVKINVQIYCTLS
jgi:hypothetical protein